MGNILATLEPLVYDKTGLRIDPARHENIARLLDELQVTYNLASITDLFDHLQTTDSHSDIWQVLVHSITIGETYFFRNKYHMQALFNHVLPTLIKKRRASDARYLNIWSAGCASGEEAYSIAIMLCELLPDIDQWIINILGTDINHTSVEAARRGIYRAHSFRTETRSDIQDRYFSKDGTNYVLSDTIRRMVSFELLNLITDDYPSVHTRTLSQDIILCRNVTIYFDQPTTKTIVNRFYDALVPEGWLVVGHAEPQATIYDAFDTHNYNNAIFYQKPRFPQRQSVTVSPVIQKPVQIAPVTTKPRTTGRLVANHQVAPQITIEQVYDKLAHNQTETALVWLDTLHDSDPMNPVVHYLRGMIALNDDDLNEAHKNLRRALYCDPNFLLAHYLIGDIHWQQKRTPDAYRSWRTARYIAETLDPDALLPGSVDLTAVLFLDLVLSRLESEGMPS